MRIRYARLEGTFKIVRVEGEGTLPAELLPIDPATLSETTKRAPGTAARLRAFTQALRRDHARSQLVAYTGRDPSPSPEVLEPRAIGDLLSLGRQLRLARQVARISQRDLAREFGYARSTVADVERGRRRLPLRLANWATGVLRNHQGQRGPDGGA